MIAQNLAGAPGCSHVPAPLERCGHTAIRLSHEFVAPCYRLRRGGEGLQYTRGMDMSAGLALETAHLGLILPLLALDVKTAR